MEYNAEKHSNVLELDKVLNLLSNEATMPDVAQMAQKIVLEIKDKLTKMNIGIQITSAQYSNAKISQETIKQTTVILESLGYNQNEYKKAIETALGAIEKDDEQELLRETLKILSIF